MYGHASRIDGGHACGGYHHRFFRGNSGNVFQKGRLTCSGPSREVNGTIRGLNKLYGRIEFPIVWIERSQKLRQIVHELLQLLKFNMKLLTDQPHVFDFFWGNQQDGYAFLSCPSRTSTSMGIILDLIRQLIMKHVG